jgi:hypothetical protein
MASAKRISAHWRSPPPNIEVNHASSLAHKDQLVESIANLTRPKDAFDPVMVDPPKDLALTVSRSPLEGQQRSARVSVSIDSSYSSPQVPANFYHGAPCPAPSFPSKLSQTRLPSSHRRLPTPPVHVSRSPSASTSPTSSSSPSLPTQLPTSRRQSVFVL